MLPVYRKCTFLLMKFHNECIKIYGRMTPVGRLLLTKYEFFWLLYTEHKDWNAYFRKERWIALPMCFPGCSLFVPCGS